MNILFYFIFILICAIALYEINHFIYFSRILIKKFPIYPIFNIYNKNNYSQADLNILVNHSKLPVISDLDNIPNNLFQIYILYDKSNIPNYIFEKINTFAPNYNYYLYDDDKALHFLNSYFSNLVVQRFKDLKLGAHKADLLRYCLLYVYGGVYLDIKTLLIKPLDEIFVNKTYFYTCLMDFDTVIYNGLIASKPRNNIFLHLIYWIVNIPLYIVNEPTKLVGYLSFCLDLYKYIQIDTNSNKLTNGFYKGITQNYYLFKEVATLKINDTCTKLDRYGGCIDIYDFDTKIFIGRDPDFPW